jgi:hypothetical protein
MMGDDEVTQEQRTGNGHLLQKAEAFGVDLSLLHERLTWTPTERLVRHQESLAFLEAVRAAGERARDRS